MRLIPFLLVVLVAASPAYAQQHGSAASLESALKQATSDSEKVSLLVRLSSKYRQAGKPAIAMQYGDEALAIGLRAPQRILLAKALIEKGSNATGPAGNTLALQCLTDALSLVAEGSSGSGAAAAIRRRYADAQPAGSQSAAVTPFNEVDAATPALSADSDVVRLNAHAAMFEMYESGGQAASGMRHLDEMARCAARAKKPLDEAWALAQVAALKYSTGDLKGAYSAMQRELALGERETLPDVKADALYRLAALYESTGDFPRSVACHQQAISLFKVQGNRIGLASTLSNLGKLYAAHGDYEKALQLYRQAVDSCGSEPYSEIRAATTHNIGDALFHLGKAAEATQYYRMATGMNLQDKRWKFLVQNQMSLAALHLAARRYDSADYYYGAAEQLAERQGYADDIAGARAGFGRLYFVQASDTNRAAGGRQALLGRAIAAFAAAEKEAASLGLASLLQEVYAGRSDAEKAAGNYKASMEYYQKSVAIKDSLFSQQNAFKIARLESEAALAQKDTMLRGKVAEAAGLRHRQLYITGIGAGLLLVATAGLLLYRNSRRRKEQLLKAEFEARVKEVEMQALRAQMNPHFIFNCLNSINRYIVKSDPQTASGYLTKFSKLIRFILDNSAATAIPLAMERQMLQLYAEMESLRFSRRFSYDIGIDEGMRPDDLFIPPMLVQPYVENAIWHGLMHKEEGVGHLSVRFEAEGSNMIKAVIEDNGVGRARAAELKSKNATRSKSYGMSITGDRLRLVNERHGTSASVQIEDLAGADSSASGTRVTIHIPVTQAPVAEGTSKFV